MSCNPPGASETYTREIINPEDVSTQIMEGKIMQRIKMWEIFQQIMTVCKSGNILVSCQLHEMANTHMVALETWAKLNIVTH